MLRIIRRFIIVVTVLVALTMGYVFWYSHRPLPAEVREKPLFQGITYTREVRREPHPMIIHVIKVDLKTPGIGFLVTPRDQIAGYEYAARTTSQFLEEFGVQLAINGDFFQPWRDITPWDYYPHSGDGVNVRGLAISQGELVTTGYYSEENYNTLFISPGNQLSFEKPTGPISNAISGNEMVVMNGVYSTNEADNGYLKDPHPRTVVALDKGKTTLIIIVVDGRQPNYSDGATFPELADIVLRYGGFEALNLDGGGSSTLVIEGEDGKPLQLGSAIHGRIPARERPSANHLGIYAAKL